MEKKVSTYVNWQKKSFLRPRCKIAIKNNLKIFDYIRKYNSQVCATFVRCNVGTIRKKFWQVILEVSLKKVLWFTSQHFCQSWVAEGYVFIISANVTDTTTQGQKTFVDIIGLCQSFTNGLCFFNGFRSCKKEEF